MMGGCSLSTTSSTISASCPAGVWSTARTQCRHCREKLNEEIGGGVEIGRLVIVADNLFELDGIRYQEAGLYFVLDFAPDHPILSREGRFEAAEPNLVYEWLSLDELEEEKLFPRFLRELVLDIPQTPKYVIQSDIESCWAESYPNLTET